jgi:hypothetical protein
MVEKRLENLDNQFKNNKITEGQGTRWVLKTF